MKKCILVLCSLLLSGCVSADQELGTLLQELFILLGVFFSGVLVYGIRRYVRSGSISRVWPNTKEYLTGAITDFFDTLGIGSFAPTTAIFRFWRMVPDELIPGTLNVGHTLPTIVQALIFIQLVPVDSTTLLAMITASAVGAWIGTGVVSGLPRFHIRIGMGAALIVAATIMLLSQLGYLPGGGEATALTGTKLGLGVVANFVLGILMPLGIGLYAPCMIVVSLLGMSPLAAFPIMMGSCAVLMPISSVVFCRSGKFQVSAALGLALAGIPAVLLAAFLVKSLPLSMVRWLVITVVLYVAVSLLRAGYLERDARELKSFQNL